MDRGTSRVVGVEQSLDGPLAHQGSGDGGGDALAGHIGQFLVHELRRISVAFADEIGIEPLLGDALELTEEVEFRLLAGIAPLGVQQAVGKMKQQRGAAAYRPGAQGSGRRPRQ